MTTAEEEYRNRLEQVYRNNFFFLVRYARNKISNKARAEEMVQEAFRIALERPPSHTEGLARWLRYKVDGVISNSRRAGPDATVRPKIKHELECRFCPGKIKQGRVCTKCGAGICPESRVCLKCGLSWRGGEYTTAPRGRICTTCGLAYPKDYKKALEVGGIFVARAGRREITTRKTLDQLDHPGHGKAWTSQALDERGMHRGGKKTKRIAGADGQGVEDEDELAT